MKRIKLGLIGSLIVGAVFYYTALPAVTTPVKSETNHVRLAENSIDRHSVISALSEESEIVGLSGKVSKTIVYHDKLFDSGSEFIDGFAERTYQITLNGTFKLGMQINAIDFVIGKRSVDVITPNVTLIALELPYDQMVIESDVGVLRRDLSDEDKQRLYALAKTKVIREIMSDRETVYTAEFHTQKAIEKLLRSVPNVENVRFYENREAF